MVNLTKAYNDLARTKALIDREMREKATRYISMAAPELLNNPRTADQEIRTLSNLLANNATDSKTVTDYLSYLTQKSDPEVARMTEQQKRLNNMKEARARGYL